MLSIKQKRLASYGNGLSFFASRETSDNETASRIHESMNVPYTGNGESRRGEQIDVIMFKS